MLPILVQHLPRDRELLGVSEANMAWLLGSRGPQYRELEAGQDAARFVTEALVDP